MGFQAAGSAKLTALILSNNSQSRPCTQFCKLRTTVSSQLFTLPSPRTRTAYGPVLTHPLELALGPAADLGRLVLPSSPRTVNALVDTPGLLDPSDPLPPRLGQELRPTLLVEPSSSCGGGCRVEARSTSSPHVWFGSGFGEKNGAAHSPTGRRGVLCPLPLVSLASSSPRRAYATTKRLACLLCLSVLVPPGFREQQLVNAPHTHSGMFTVFKPPLLAVLEYCKATKACTILGSSRQPATGALKCSTLAQGEGHIFLAGAPRGPTSFGGDRSLTKPPFHFRSQNSRSERRACLPRLRTRGRRGESLVRRACGCFPLA